MALRAGDLDRRIAILQPISRRDAMNAIVIDYVEVGKRWAKQLTQRPTQAWKGGQTAASLEVAWQMRWDSLTSSLDTGFRISIGGQTYRILGVTEPLRREAVEVVAVAIVDGSDA